MPKKVCKLRVRRLGRNPSEAAQEFVSKHIEHHISDLGMPPRQAIRAAYEEAAEAGFKVPPPGANRRKNPRRRRVRSTSLRFRNPVIGKKLLGALTYEGGQGKKRGSRWIHHFKSPLRILGNRDGSVTLRSKDGKSIWDYFDVPRRRGGIA